MARIRWTPQAADDLESIAAVPECDDPAVRELLLGNYRIVYRLKDDNAEILTVYHGARLLALSALN